MASDQGIGNVLSYPADRSEVHIMNIPFILEKALSLYAKKEAIVCGERRYTYEQFADRVYRLANFLKGRGVRKGDRVAILHQNSHEFLECYFATAQLGAVLNPLNVRLSPRELAFILKDSGSLILAAAGRFKRHLSALMDLEPGVDQIILTGESGNDASFKFVGYEEILRAEDNKPPDVPEISDGDLAHLYYTSGTTGRPKGVMLSHKNVCSHALAAIAELRLSDRDNWLHVAPLFHLADAWATFAMTWVGGKHVVITDFEPPAVLSTIQDEKVTITNMIPTMLNMLVNTPGVGRYDFSSLRVLLSGGAPIAPQVVRRIMDTFKCDYIQTYGMTETSPYLTVSIIKDNLAHLPSEKQFFYKAKTGRPFLGVLLKVVREDGTDVKADDREVGEIIVKGDTVTSGYWRFPEETDKAIRDGWLYTGDLAVIDEEGYVNIVDRKKDMILTGGENVFSTEVENVLYMHPGVLEAAVIGVPDPKWGEAVKACVVLRPGQEATDQEIISFCKDNLAHYKAPKSVDFLNALPRTGSGKIYKKGLRDPYWQQK
ncbi:MAG: long-chain-fatty-acid--CoA ligase [Desulfobacteraceae bacterium]|jgi:acyl-CoA synthetase (AMP-forming)/AMP-acid ligase II